MRCFKSLSIWNQDSLIRQFWLDEKGYILSAEAVLIGTVGVLGATVGLSAVSQSVNDELTDVAFAFRSLDQSYSIPETRGCNAWTAGSSFKQKPVAQAHAELSRDVEHWKHEARERQEKLHQNLEREAQQHQEKLHQNLDREHQERLEELMKKQKHELEKLKHELEMKKQDLKKDPPKKEMDKPAPKKEMEKPAPKKDKKPESREDQPKKDKDSRDDG